MLKFYNLYTRTLYDLPLTNPITRLLLVPRRSDSYPYRNQTANYTNWVDQKKAPWKATPGGTVAQNTTISSGVFIPNAQPQIIQTLRLLLDGNELQEEKPVEFYTRVQTYRTITGASLPESQFLPIMNLSLTSPQDQPSGSVNASRIRLFQLDVGIWPLPVPPTYVYELFVYAENINFFVVESGYGGLKFAL
jgi:hypothetical protein